MSSLKSDLLALQKGLYDYTKRKALGLETEVSSELRSYQRAQKKYADRLFSVVGAEELKSSIEKAQVVYLGDFHTFDQSSKNLERILRLIKKRPRHFALGMEMVHTEHQPIIDQYLEGHITEIEFLESVNYHDSWKFPWNHYRPFFDMARKSGTHILALNSRGNLTQRDKHAAALISDYVKERPDCTLLVLFGELHILRDKLPAKVEARLQSVRQTIIHQNLDDIFWRLQEMGHSVEENSTIVKFDRNEYCLMSSPPWIKYESMIYWYENLCDDPEFDLHEYIMVKGTKGFSSDAHDYFVYVCSEILKQLRLPDLNEDDLEDFNLYDSTNLAPVESRLHMIEDKRLARFYRKLVQHGENFRVPFTNALYCAGHSINRVAFLAGVHLRAKYIQLTDEESDKVMLSRDLSRRFLFLLYDRIVGYLSSKVINPYRKCDRYLDLERKSRRSDQGAADAQAAVHVLDLESPEELSKALKGMSLLHLHNTAKMVGNFLGDVLYERFFSAGDSRFKELFQTPLSSDVSAEKFYDFLRKVLPTGSYKKTKKRLF